MYIAHCFLHGKAAQILLEDLYKSQRVPSCMPDHFCMMKVVAFAKPKQDGVSMMMGLQVQSCMQWLVPMQPHLQVSLGPG